MYNIFLFGGKPNDRMCWSFACLNRNIGDNTTNQYIT